MVINGKFLTQKITGIQRYARELLAEFDKLINRNEIELAVPSDAKDIPEYKNIRVVKIGRLHGLLWEMISFPRYVRKKRAVALNFCNVTPFFLKPGFTAVHDIMYRVNPSHYTSLRNRISRYWHMLQYSYIAKHEEKIITVSNFSKHEIEKYYPASKGKITVIPSAWQHILNIEDSKDWQKRYPFLADKKFFFSLATLSKNKNCRWIIEAAKKNPDYLFAIAGKHYETIYNEIPSNVYMLGYVSDEDACALMKHCRAFIFPSFYEGFGLPPLEALALGAEVISSNAASLPEVFGESVRYINPNDTDVNIDEILKNKTEDREKTLQKYSWEKSAALLYDLVKMNTFYKTQDTL